VEFLDHSVDKTYSVNIYDFIRRLLNNKGSGTTVDQGAIVALQCCSTRANAKSAISVLNSGEAVLAQCTTASEVPNISDSSAKLKYEKRLTTPEHITLALIKVLAVVALFVLTGAAAAFNGMLRLAL
jgi:hypothetical protein